MRPLIQVALDLIDKKQALSIAEIVAPYVDIMEAGTPLLKVEGIKIIEALKKRHPNKVLLADTKTMDVGALEAKLVFDAGADIMTVCAAAGIKTISAAINEAERQGKEVMVDFIGIEDKISRAKEISSLKPHYFNLHTAIDIQMTKGKSFEEVETFSKESSIPLAIAGGLVPEDIAALMPFNPAILIFGGFITKASDPKGAVLEINKEIDSVLS